MRKVDFFFTPKWGGQLEARIQSPSLLQLIHHHHLFIRVLLFLYLHKPLTKLVILHHSDSSQIRFQTIAPKLSDGHNDSAQNISGKFNTWNVCILYIGIKYNWLNKTSKSDLIALHITSCRIENGYQIHAHWRWWKMQ